MQTLKLLLLSALLDLSIGAPAVTSETFFDNGPSGYTLTPEISSALKSHIDSTFAELLSNYDCAEGASVTVSNILSAAKSIETSSVDQISLIAMVSTFDSSVSMSVDESAGQYLRVHDLDTFDIFPECVASALRAEAATAAASQEPSTSEERAERDREVRA